jgi:serine phosphatase RsbU (regulator of sigma subunit)
MDVTGHGIPAALTVNRLHGELTRIFAEHPDMQPGEVLCLLNKYTHLTLSNHSVYVTAMCISVDPRTETLTYASGGHPPAFLRDAAGRVHEMESTTFVLGACPPEHFHADPKTIPFHPGDTVIAYTDGATEARDEHGRYFGINGIQKIVACENPDPDGGWPTTIRRAVEKYRFGPTADDILVIEIRRPVTLNGLVEGQPA